MEFELEAPPETIEERWERIQKDIEKYGTIILSTDEDDGLGDYI